MDYTKGMNALPLLIAEDLIPTRNYIQDVVKVLGSLQLAYVAPNEHEWQYGLEVTMRGISTQEMMVGGQHIRATVDLVKHKVRIGDTNWSLEEYAAPEILNHNKVWLTARSQRVELEQPEFSADTKYFDAKQAAHYAEALWWLEKRFKGIKTDLDTGLTSPILLYPHHFDIALSWFPQNDTKQLSLGFSSGDESIKEPYLYLTAYPEPDGFTNRELPAEAYWQTAGFRGAILPYARLQASQAPDAVFDDYASLILEG
ncbi:MAG: hypothetical protein JWO35_39 [Candidatus Saccharibacteria bacterium]|nr:hypothetical protein [Candidatus Saccharibacteria bacterium]